MRVCAWGTRPQVSRVEQVLPVVSYILYKDQANLRPLRWAHQQLQPRQTVSPKSQVPPAPVRVAIDASVDIHRVACALQLSMDPAGCTTCTSSCS
jgi:hypothetical protein